ncbi:BEL12_AG transposon polyprotein [Culex quinquefasciatus]|uniref:BEL12_AG transposon polyprotein n=1 Tax=Culex quinquefasciatus TaxID=7176 RepID=B0WMR1_CULQU|nr:BEL12_AG transposon polyprotein [Culex quinquefasciatus]|eukprot:XP_001849988.1 BEL12_AG transposon polyprotein [Culex quinquefasciatus]
MWRSLLKLYPEPGSENEKEEEKLAVIVPVPSPVKPLTPKKLWEKKKAKMADGEVKALSKKRSQVKGKLTRILHAVQPSTQPGALPGAQAREADHDIVTVLSGKNHVAVEESGKNPDGGSTSQVTRD